MKYTPEWMLKTIIILLFTIHCLTAFGQQGNDDFINHGLGFKIQTMISYPYHNEIDAPNYDPGFGIEINTIIAGMHGELNYYFMPYFGLGIGGGYEIITQPRIAYYPLYANFIGIVTQDKSTLYAKLNFGSHLGEVAKRGFIFRAGLGLRIKVHKNILSYFELTYSFQNVYKSFELSPRPVNYYNIESIGLTIGIGIN